MQVARTKIIESTSEALAKVLSEAGGEDEDLCDRCHWLLSRYTICWLSSVQTKSKLLNHVLMIFSLDACAQDLQSCARR